MKRIELRPAARRDMLRLEKFLQKKSPSAALRAFDDITRRILILRDHPLLGVERASGFRELVLRYGRSAYVVRYKVTDDAVVITRIWHGKEDR